MTLTIDLQEQIDHIDERMAEIREEAQDVDRDSAEAIDLEEEYEELREARRTVTKKINEWDGSQFTVKDPTWGDQARINDRVRAATLEDDSDDPRGKMGVRKIHSVQVLVESKPPNAPDHAREFPSAIGQYLWDRIDRYTRVGDDGGGQGNSLWDELEQTESTQTNEQPS